MGILGVAIMISGLLTSAGFSKDSDSAEYTEVANNLKEGDYSDFGFEAILTSFAGFFALIAILAGALAMVCSCSFCVCLKWCGKPGAFGIGCCSFTLLIVAIFVSLIIAGISFASTDEGFDMYCGANA